MKVLVTGATGFVGKILVRQLVQGGHEVVILTRNVANAALNLGSKNCKYFLWSDTNQAPPAEAFVNIDGVINLLGESIADKKWDDAQKRKIHDSRVNGTTQLVKTISTLSHKPKVFVSTSAVGIYGNREDEDVTESSKEGNDFLATVCKDWEDAAMKAQAFASRVVIIRVGVVLGRGGGALKKMLPIFKLGGGGPLGTGRQYMSWIHVEDLAAMYVEALKNENIQGPYNGTAPYPATNKEFTKALGRALKRPTFAPAPAFVMKLVFGEMSQMLLEGQKVLPLKFKDQKFRYRYPTLEMALKDSAH